MTPTVSWLLAIAVMAAVTFSLRALPLAAYRWLTASRFVDALNRRLPLCVMVVLLLFSLRGGAGEPVMLVSELLGLAAVAATYVRWRNPLASVVAGLAILNGVQWLVARLL